MKELKDYQRTYLRDYATESICDDMDDAIDFLNIKQTNNCEPPGSSNWAMASPLRVL